MLSISEGRFRYTTDETEAKEKPFAGVNFSFSDIFKITPDHANGGKTIDFSGEKAYPFPFTLMLQQRELTLASKSREDREMWVRGFQVLLEYKESMKF